MRVFVWASAFILLATFFARAMETEPVPPPMVAGFADGNGQIGIFAGAGGGVDGVNLVTGKKIWTSREGKFPVHSTFGWVAVAAPAPGQALRIRFLRPGDGKAFGKDALVTFSAWVAAGNDFLADESGASFYSDDVSFGLSAWSILPSRNPDPDPRAGWLRLRWQATQNHVSGMRLGPEKPQTAAGLVLINPGTGEVAPVPIEREEIRQPADPELLPDWKPEKNLRYYGWRKHASAWTDKPRPFRIGGAFMGYLAYEEPTRTLLLHRWRPGEPLSPVEISRGKEQGIFVSLNGNHLVLVEGNAGSETFQLVDLIRGGGNPQSIPRLETGYRQPVVVLGQKLFYVTETRGERSDMKTEIKRRLMAMDLTGKRKDWSYALASRFEYGPYPGSGKGFK